MNSLVGILVLLFSLAAYGDSLSLYLIRSPKGINWNSPWSLTYSTLRNGLIKYEDRRTFSISHVYVELNCESRGVHLFRGMTSNGDDQERDLVLKKKYGLGVMFFTYDGLLEKDQFVLDGFTPYLGSSRLSKLNFEVTADACERMVTYAEDFEARGFGHMYSGLQADPLKGEGAGCSAFAMSFLEVAGLLRPEFYQEWRRFIDIPKRFIGGPMTGNRVSVLKLLTHPRARWNDKEPHVHLEAWDPELMNSWVKKIFERVESGEHLTDDWAEWNPRISRFGNSREVTLDFTQYPTPTGNYWKF